MGTQGNREKVLTAKQMRALEALLTDGNVSAAAQTAGVSRKSLYEWLKQPHFASELRRLEGEVLSALGRRLLALGEDATDAVSAGLDPAERMNTRLRAAQLVLEHGSRLAELLVIVGRLEALERKEEVFR